MSNVFDAYRHLQGQNFVEATGDQVNATRAAHDASMTASSSSKPNKPGSQKHGELHQKALDAHQLASKQYPEGSAQHLMHSIGALTHWYNIKHGTNHAGPSNR